MSVQSHPKIVLDFARGEVRTGSDAEGFTTEGMVATRSGLHPQRTKRLWGVGRVRIRATDTLQGLWRSARGAFG